MSWFNWQSYNFEKYGLPQETPPPGKLLLYPMEVSPSGEISNIDQFRSFPDYPETAKVFGGKSGMIPEKVTT